MKGNYESGRLKVNIDPPSVEVNVQTDGENDRKSLSESESEMQSSTSPKELPAGDSEMSVASIWKEVTRKADVQPSANFFEAGGTSLQAFRLLDLIHSRLNARISFLDFQKIPTIQNLAQLVDQERRPKNV